MTLYLSVQTNRTWSVDQLVAFSEQNDLIVEIQKSSCMVVKGGSRKLPKLQIQVQGRTLEQVAEFCYLDFFFDEHLSLARSADHHARQCQKFLCVPATNCGFTPKRPVLCGGENV